ncbi:DUF397 domain-containing protein [Streptomyces sp. RGM 3693]|uniref:DUF397 domain-containing protein n=1 Tax=Streptomyces sp. RGM 3693 TaxID=3413284 RepID=UPI003D2872CE
MTGKAAMSAGDLTEATWFKSSYSGTDQSQCVEAADLTGTAYVAIAVRDSKYPQGPALLFSASDWSSFVSAVGRGGFTTT